MPTPAKTLSTRDKQRIEYFRRIAQANADCYVCGQIGHNQAQAKLNEIRRAVETLLLGA